MLKTGLIVALMLFVAGCSERHQQAAAPVALEAGYALFYNDTLVGNALFTLEITADGAYRLEAFTVPAGDMQRAGDHEILESSEGHIDDHRVRPHRYAESVLQDGAIALASVTFDWAENSLTVSGPEGEKTLTLVRDTHDRLSYLLAAHRLGDSDDAAALIQVATPAVSEESRLQREGIETLSTPIGELESVVISRVTPDSEETRRLWYADDAAPLPVRVMQQRDGNVVEMRLASIAYH